MSGEREEMPRLVRTAPEGQVSRLPVSAFVFNVPNPFGVCALGRVAVIAANRTEAVRRIKAEGIKITRRDLTSPPKLTSADRATIEAQPDTVWIRGVGLHANNAFIDDDPWRPVAQFRERYG